MKNNIVIVEGKSDENRLKAIFKDIKIITTNGFNIKKETINTIKMLSKDNNIVIFTDPDWAGNKIREKLNEILKNKCLNAFINIENIKKKKKGVAEADESDIRNAFNNLISFENNQKSLSWEEYLNKDIYLKKNRKKIAEYFGWNLNISSKTLFKYINFSNLKIDTILMILGEKND